MIFLRYNPAKAVKSLWKPLTIQGFLSIMNSYLSIKTGCDEDSRIDLKGTASR